MKKSKTKSLVLILVANLIWGTSAFMVNLFPDLDTLTIIWGRVLFGSFSMLILFVVSGKSFRELIQIRTRIKTLFLSSLAFLGTVGFMTAGVKHSDVSTTVFLLYTAPVFVLLFSNKILGAKIKQKDLLPMMLASIGLVFIFGKTLAGKFVIGDIFGLLAGISWGLQMIIVKKLGENLSSVVASFWGMMISLILLTPFAEIYKVFTINLPLIIFYGIVNNGIAAVAFYEGIKYVKSKKAGLLSLIDPIENSILAFIFYSEVPTVGTFIGGLYILLSIIYGSVD